MNIFVVSCCFLSNAPVVRGNRVSNSPDAGDAFCLCNVGWFEAAQKVSLNCVTVRAPGHTLRYRRCVAPHSSVLPYFSSFVFTNLHYTCGLKKVHFAVVSRVFYLWRITQSPWGQWAARRQPPAAPRRRQEYPINDAWDATSPKQRG